MKRFGATHLRAIFFLVSLMALILAVGAPESLPWKSPCQTTSYFTCVGVGAGGFPAAPTVATPFPSPPPQPTRAAASATAASAPNGSAVFFILRPSCGRCLTPVGVGGEPNAPMVPLYTTIWAISMRVVRKYHTSLRG